MSELLQSLRADLLSRRMLPLLAAAVLALAVALGYALAGSGAGSNATTHARTAGAAPQSALAVAAASPNPNAAESETPGGARYQNHGALRNPFEPLPQAKKATSKSSSASRSSRGASSVGNGSGGSSGGSGGSGSGGSGGASKAKGEEATPPKPSKPTPSYPYDVSVLFGQLPASGQAVTLPPYQSLQPQQPLPSAADARIALERVNRDAKSAVFALLQAPILRGQGVCLPSPADCQELALEVGHAEELEYVEASGQTVVYELKTVSIVRSSSQTAG